MKIYFKHIEKFFHCTDIIYINLRLDYRFDSFMTLLENRTLSKLDSVHVGRVPLMNGRTGTNESWADDDAPNWPSGDYFQFPNEQ